MDLENKYGTQEFQLRLLGLLKEFDAFCAKNNIIYSLAGGSLLGAIRHNGIIPWDDDLDIIADRENYTRLLQEIKKSDNFVLSRSIWIYMICMKEDASLDIRKRPTLDLFVFDNVPDSKLINGIKLSLLKVLQGMMKKKPSYERYSLLYKVCIFITYSFGRLFPYKLKFKLYDAISQIGNGRKTTYVTCYNTMFKYLNLRYNNTLLKNIIRHPFDNIEAPITAEYDHYLRNQYRDYMKLPPEADRKPSHTELY